MSDSAKPTSKRTSQAPWWFSGLLVCLNLLQGWWAQTVDIEMRHEMQKLDAEAQVEIRKIQADCITSAQLETIVRIAQTVSP